MKRVLFPLVVIVLTAIMIDADLNGYVKIYPPELPTVNVPRKLRQHNWVRGRPGNGSCTWASTISLLRWQEQYALADKIRRTRGGGVPLSQFSKRLNAAGVKHLVRAGGSAAFLEWACEARLGAVVGIQEGGHAVTLVHLSTDTAYLLDNNFPKEFQQVPREEFLSDWKGAGGWAFVPLYNPASPLP